MKKFLTVLLSLMLAITATAAIVTVSAKDGRDHYTAEGISEYFPGNAMDVYESYVNGNVGEGYACRNAINLFKEAKYKNSWLCLGGGALTIANDGTATLYQTGATAHPLKNYKFGYGTFLMTFQIENHADVKEGGYVTGSGSEVSQFWGIEFSYNIDVGNNYETLGSPWGSPGGYQYNLAFDGEKCPDDIFNYTGLDGQATLPDGTLVADAMAANPDGEYGRIYQTGLTLRRYKYGGSHDYYRWSTTNPCNARFQNSIGQEMISIVPEHYREVRLEDVWDGNEHSILCQYRPLSKDNGDGIDAMFIEVWMSGLAAKEGDVTEEVNGKTFVKCLTVYDEMPFDDVDNEGVVVDKRMADGYITIWTHDETSYSAGKWNSKINISEFSILDSGSYADYDVNQFEELSGVSILGGSKKYDGNEYQFTLTKDDQTNVTFYDIRGNVIAEGAENAPKYSDAGEYYVNVKFAKPGYKPVYRDATLSIAKSQTRISADNRYTFTYDGTEHKIENATATNSKGENIGLDDKIIFSPANSFTEAGIYTVIITLPETKNYEAQTKKVTVTVQSGSSGGSTGSGAFTDQEKAQIDASWTGDVNTVYDGSEKIVTLGYLPEGAYAVYTENCNVNAGTYTVTATVKKDGYNDYVVTTTMTIAKADVEIIAEATQTYNYCNAEVSAKAYTTTGAAVEVPTKKEVGTYTIEVTVAESANYNAATKQITLIIVQ